METAVNAESSILAYIAVVDEALNKSRDITIMIVVKLISDMINFLNLGKNMSPSQIKETAEMILVDEITKNLKPEDLKVCFDRMKKGNYGKFYDRMDGSVIFECLYSYSGERADLIESKSIQQASNETGQKRGVGISPELLPVLKSVLKEIPKEEPKKFKSTLKADSRIQELFNEFDKLWQNSPDRLEKYGTRFVIHNDKPVSQDKWVEIMLNKELIKNNQNLEL